MPRAHELRELAESELQTHIETQRREIFGLRFQHATGSLEDTSALRTAKRELARALTIARQRASTSTNAEN
jgi:large subunit ribosomal protein L29